MGEGLFRKILESTLLEKKRKMQVGPKEQMECDTRSVTAAGPIVKLRSRNALSELSSVGAEDAQLSHYISLEIFDLYLDFIKLTV